MASTLIVDQVTKVATAWGQEVDNAVYNYLSGVAGTNTITATGPVGLAAYAAGLSFRFIPAATNTGATTINITGTGALGARNVFCGGAACVGGELRIGIPATITDDGTQFNIIGPFSGGKVPGNASFAGTLSMSAASAKIIGGSNSLSIRNNADSADNWKVNDAGTMETRDTPTFLSATAVPAGGTVGKGIQLSSATNFGVFFGSGAPTLSAAKGSIYLRSDGSTTNDRAYVNTNGSTTWTALTTVA